ncbi:hypothetical protein ACFFRR_007380 [Megaselia abdita]
MLLCLRCLHLGHESPSCLGDSAIVCTMCWRLNFFTVNCCKALALDDHKYHQSFRLAKEFSAPPMFHIDVDVFGENAVAVVSTGTEMSSVSTLMLSFLRRHGAIENKSKSSWKIQVPVKLRTVFMLLTCTVTESMGTYTSLVLGRDFLDQRPHHFKLDGQLLRSFYTQVEIGGLIVKAIINTSLKRSTISHSMVQTIKQLSNHAHKEVKGESLLGHPIWRISTPFKYQNEPHMLQCDVVSSKEDIVVELGMDFLYPRNVIMKLDNITLCIKKSWVNKDPNQVEFAYNHTKGGELALYLRKRKYVFEEDYMRKVIRDPYIPVADDDSDSD